MPGLIIDRKEYAVSDLFISNYKDVNHAGLKLKAGEDMRRRTTSWVRSIVLHNTKNIETKMKPGRGPSTSLGERIAKLWSTDARNAGAHLSVDWDGTISCHADLLLDAAYHAGTMNEVSIGIEIYEDNKGIVYEEQLKATCKLVVGLCSFFRIQKQMPHWDDHKTIDAIVSGGKTCVGVFGHRHQKATKQADPGNDIFAMLLHDFGFKEFDFHSAEDSVYWRKIQFQLGIEALGYPDPTTCDALQLLGFLNGLYDFKTPL